MTEHDPVADLLVRVLDEDAPMRPPDRLVPETLRSVAATRRVPRWSALLRVEPLRVAGQVAVGSPALRIATFAATAAALVVAAAAVTVAGMALLDQAGPSAPRVIIVDGDGGGDVRTLADGVELAHDGDRLVVMPGTYVEAVEVTEDISISGSGDRETVILQAPPDGPTAAIDAAGDRDPFALRFVEVTGTLSNLTFQGEPSQLHVWGGSPQLQDLYFEDVGRRYLPLSGEYTGNAVVLTGGTTATLVNARLFGGGPIGILDRSEPRLIANHLGNGPHIWGFMGDGTLVSGNNVTGSADRAIGVFGTTRARIENNTIDDAGGDGITVGWGTEGATDPVVRGNTIRSSGTGINLAGIDVSPTVEANVLIGNSVGIAIVRSDAAIRGNVIEDSVIAIRVQDGLPLLDGNRLCRNATDLLVPAVSTLTLDGNEPCAEAS